MSAAEEVPRVDVVVLAAGKGTRMKSDRPKVLHELAGRPLLHHVLDRVREAGWDRTIVVVGYQAERVRQACDGRDLSYVVQEPQLGTGHAVMIAEPRLRAGGLTIILAGDVPLIRAATLQRLVAATAAQDVAASVLTCVVADAGAYGRVIRDGADGVQRIVEARDATPAELAVGEYNTGFFCFRTDRLRGALARLTNDNDQREYYLTDTVAHLVAQDLKVAAVTCDDPEEVVGVNTVAELRAAEEILRRRAASSADS